MDVLNVNLMIWFLALIVAVKTDDFCSSGTPSPSAPNLPFVSSTYQAHVEVNILDMNYSMAVDEYLDYDGNRAAMTINKAGQTQNLIFSYSTNEVFDINGQGCKIYTVENSPYTFLLGPTNITGRPHIFTAADSLRFTSDNNPVYNGTGTVRGIQADIWSTCLVWPGAVGHIRVTYYFSQIGWNTSSPEQQIPLRIEVEGATSSPSNNGAAATTTKPTTPRHFHHIYDFVGYLPYIVETIPSVFQTPPDVVCLNRTNVRALPKFDPQFKYKAEIVDSVDSSITHYAIWYDEDYKLLREDTRKADPSSANGETIISTTEIHDFNTGVRYIMNPIGGCSVKPIEPSEADTDQDVSRFQFNGSLFVDMRNPNSFFVLNYNYSYTGWRKIRGITCDVFSTIVPDYELQGTKYNAIFEYAFLADGWNDIPIYSSQSDVQNYPVQLVISIPTTQYTRVYNFFEFSEGIVTYPIFDISSCFDETQKLGFQITFPGQLGVGLQEQWTLKIYDAVAKAMQVFPIRVGGITVTGDDDNVYVNAYVLGPSVLAQFNETGIVIERENDLTIKGIKMLDECAALCVDNQGFTCLGFQYCQDDGFACRLGKQHTATNVVPFNGTACQEFSRRTLIVTKREPTLKEAYTSLSNAVYGGSFQITIATSEAIGLALFTAIDVELVSGKIVEDKPLPTLPSAFSYRMEKADPRSTSVMEVFIWYDDNMNFVRYQTKDPASENPVSLNIIHDYNSGVAFEINQKTRECDEKPIPSSSVFDVVATGSLNHGAISLTMKTSNALFFLDDTYTYVGEGTARGILCDVFESKRADFNEDYRNTSTKDTVFKYYFQTGTWTYTSPLSTVAARNQPVQLNVEVKSKGNFYTYSFYDFTEQHFATSIYDTSPCYTSEETKTFIIIFKNQPYHPVLDSMSEVFVQAALNKLAAITFMSPINFQHVSLSYDESDIYLLVTALGHVTPLNLFTQDMNVFHNTTDNMIYALSASDCAAACVHSSNIDCNSFDYCYRASGANCLLGAEKSETASDATDNTGTCTHFSRTENDTYKGMSIDQMYLTITNNVYDNKFTVAIQLQNGTIVVYNATTIRDDMIRPNDPTGTAGSYMGKFTTMRGFQLNKDLVVVTQNGISVTECANKCINENIYECQAFDYQFSIGICRLTNIHPDVFNTTNPGVTANSFTSVYARYYTADYIKYDGVVYGTHPDKTITNIKSDELCARACTVNTDFVCESFETCNDGSCQLRRTHILDVAPTGLPPSSECSYYSRNHVFDYIRRDNQIIEGHDDSSLMVSNVSECAQMCASGVGLPSCASFEMCQIEQGEIRCILSTADPTLPNDLHIVSSLQCTLYTRANPSTGALNQTNCQAAANTTSAPDTATRTSAALVAATSTPAAPSTTTSTPAAPSTTTSTPAAPSTTTSTPAAPSTTTSTPAAPSTTTSTPAAPSTTTSTPAAPSTTTSTPAAPSTTTSTPAAPSTTTRTLAAPSTTTSTPAAPSTTISTPAAPGTETSPALQSKTEAVCSGQSDSSSDTGTRIGIAFGTLILGLLVGAASMLLFLRIRYGRHGVQEDATVLKTWDN